MPCLKSQRTISKPLFSIFLMAFLLFAAGCASVTCIHELEKAQTLFNEASQSGSPFGEPTSEQREKYRETINQVEQKTLPCLERDDHKVNAYAIEAFSRWSLGDYTGAVSAAEKGRNIYERAGLTTNIRDYGMLLIVPGFALHSQTRRDAAELLKERFLSSEEARQIARRMANALKEIDAVNSKLNKAEHIVIRANQEQLLIVLNTAKIWSKGVADPQESRAEVLDWLDQANKIAAGFPQGDYPGKESTRLLLKRLDDMRQSLGSPQ
ncbi:MAG: hypothetical protein AB2L11_12225 [Syntrophobacteraceae bacterium]